MVDLGPCPFDLLWPLPGVGFMSECDENSLLDPCLLLLSLSFGIGTVDTLTQGELLLDLEE